MEEVSLVFGASLAVLTWLVVMMPLKLFLSLVVKAGALLLLATIALPLITPRESARDYVDEAWDEVQDPPIVGERQIVGEPRRAQHALVAKVGLGSLGTFTFTLDPAPSYR